MIYLRCRTVVQVFITPWFYRWCVCGVCPVHREVAWHRQGHHDTAQYPPLRHDPPRLWGLKARPRQHGQEPVWHPTGPCRHWPPHWEQVVRMPWSSVYSMSSGSLFGWYFLFMNLWSYQILQFFLKIQHFLVDYWIHFDLWKHEEPFRIDGIADVISEYSGAPSSACVCFTGIVAYLVILPRWTGLNHGTIWVSMVSSFNIQCS